MLQIISSDFTLTGLKEKKTALATSLLFEQMNSEPALNNEPFEEAMEQALQQGKRELPESTKQDRKADERSASEQEELTQLSAVEASINLFGQSFTQLPIERIQSPISSVEDLLQKEERQTSQVEQLKSESLNEERSQLNQLNYANDEVRSNPQEQLFLFKQPEKLDDQNLAGENNANHLVKATAPLSGNDLPFQQTEFTANKEVETAERGGEKPHVQNLSHHFAENEANPAPAPSTPTEQVVPVVTTEEQATTGSTGSQPVIQGQEPVLNRVSRSSTVEKKALENDPQVELLDGERRFVQTEKDNDVPSTNQARQQVPVTDVRQEDQAEVPAVAMKSLEPEAKRVDKSDGVQPLPLPTGSTADSTVIVKQQFNSSELLSKQLFRILQAAVMNRGANGQQQLTLKLHPESLGRMQIQFIQQNQGLLIKIVADKQGTVEMVERALPNIRQLLPTLEHKIEVEQFEEETLDDNHQEKQNQQKEQQAKEQQKASLFKDWLNATSEVEEEFDDTN
ncbi:flagellar hook-length control protein FliK [Alkalihalobacillus xiaoxiensis]|uniref:Flagellar hook-length control protein FliK n=1 Tax=Shouchella xiaoxiensis TaxID=766895 RepID=A0ABS2SQ57_9BACI|nr:flagellar hook-length control protein FliK [Shouchella xiaoxiensis]MBM7837653.1 flagellar hook-length control protein FliK [Shouchella xiaoxiensis]